MIVRTTRELAALVVAGIVAVAFAAPVAATEGATYRVTIENVTEGQPLTPPLLVSHDPSVDVFQLGQAASEGVKEIAENGNVMPLMDALTAMDGVHEVVAGDAPVTAGSTQTLEIRANAGEVISWVSMLICTNDGFTGLDAAALPAASTTLPADAYDAGTEMNTEDFADIVPPCPQLTGVMSDDEGTGMSKPDLAEGGVVAAHAGIMGDSDLDPEVHGWSDPVARVTIAPTGTEMPDTRIFPVTGGGMNVVILLGVAALLGAAVVRVTVRRTPA